MPKYKPCFTAQSEASVSQETRTSYAPVRHLLWSEPTASRRKCACARQRRGRFAPGVTNEGSCKDDGINIRAGKGGIVARGQRQSIVRAEVTSGGIELDRAHDLKFCPATL